MRKAPWPRAGLLSPWLLASLLLIAAPAYCEAPAQGARAQAAKPASSKPTSNKAAANKPAAAHPPGTAIASAHSLSTQAGLDIVRQGGNAFDAAIAVSSTLSVVEPISSGIGGGGFFLLHDAKSGRDVFVDARETAPAAATPAAYLDAKGELNRD
ncbi:gamma-glutamyltransferase, partial [Streptomyces sp. S12]|nr:gamma-glutamyltransferase [Streptomyces sp. S12]